MGSDGPQFPNLEIWVLPVCAGVVSCACGLLASALEGPGSCKGFKGCTVRASHGGPLIIHVANIPPCVSKHGWGWGELERREHGWGWPGLGTGSFHCPGAGRSCWERAKG